MSAWEEAEIVEAMARAMAYEADFVPDGDASEHGVERQWMRWRGEAEAALSAIAPHLAARDAATWAQACEAAAKLLEMHASLVSVQNVDEPVHASILEAADNYMRETADVIRHLAPPQPQNGGTEP